MSSYLSTPWNYVKFGVWLIQFCRIHIQAGRRGRYQNGSHELQKALANLYASVCGPFQGLSAYYHQFVPVALGQSCMDMLCVDLRNLGEREDH